MVGATSVAVIGTDPERTSLYRLELLVTSLARHRLWLTDAYFMATSTYLEALTTAARNGVDVRLLVPGNSDIGWVANVSRTMYRRLLEAGVRVFEWNGSMVHAKTAVADGRLVRIGSTNLNLSSWVGNWELDAIVSDEAIGREMEAQFLEDLSMSTEVVLTIRRRVRLSAKRDRLPRLRQQRVRSSAGRMMADFGFVRSTLGAAMKGHRVLGAGEAWSIVVVGGLAVGLAGLAWFVPAVIAYPIMTLLGIEGVLLIWKGARLRWRGRHAPAATAGPAAGGPSARAPAGPEPDGHIAAATHGAPDA
jgi:hypothetical protein